MSEQSQQENIENNNEKKSKGVKFSKKVRLIYSIIAELNSQSEDHICLEEDSVTKFLIRESIERANKAEEVVQIIENYDVFDMKKNSPFFGITNGELLRYFSSGVLSESNGK